MYIFASEKRYPVVLTWWKLSLSLQVPVDRLLLPPPSLSLFSLSLSSIFWVQCVFDFSRANLNLAWGKKKIEERSLPLSYILWEWIGTCGDCGRTAARIPWPGSIVIKNPLMCWEANAKMVQGVYITRNIKVTTNCFWVVECGRFIIETQILTHKMLYKNRITKKWKREFLPKDFWNLFVTNL